ncbi:hypothetical protein D8B26_002220 [Coccidioides posadasii str. Silveira]|uniref:uncharacterized protein n=1 Tax=Coccidioides posadasii (strain RMSCC 757 / Silveira) TaxID=443226 RepID=UPI001BEF5A34|nr:hypothetical protein D8B26_002220 [Coccidioides posadasii str. Silveira]
MLRTDLRVAFSCAELVLLHSPPFEATMRNGLVIRSATDQWIHRPHLLLSTSGLGLQQARPRLDLPDVLIVRPAAGCASYVSENNGQTSLQPTTFRNLPDQSVVQSGLRLLL